MSRPEEQPDPYRPPDEQADPYRPARDQASRRSSSEPLEAPREFGDKPAQPPRRGRGVVVLAVVGVLAVPLWPFGFTLSAAAVGWSLWLRHHARKSGTPAPGTVTALVVGGIGMAVPVVLVVVFLPELSTFGHCMQGAHTKIAQADCQSQFESALLHKVGAR